MQTIDGNIIPLSDLYEVLNSFPQTYNVIFFDGCQTPKRDIVLNSNDKSVFPLKTILTSSSTLQEVCFEEETIDGFTTKNIEMLSKEPNILNALRQASNNYYLSSNVRPIMFLSGWDYNITLN